MPAPARLLAAVVCVGALVVAVWVFVDVGRSDGTWKGYLVGVAFLYVAFDFGIGAIFGSWPSLSFWGG